MKKNKIFLFIMLPLLILAPLKVSALNEVNIHLFYGDGCPHCEKEMVYLEEMKDHYNNITIYKYETWKNESNKNHLERIKELYQTTKTGVPFTVIGDTYISGFGNSTKLKIEELIRKYSLEEYNSKIDTYFNIAHNTNLNYSLPEPKLITEKDENTKPTPNRTINENTNENKNLESKEKKIDDRIIITLALSIVIVILLLIYLLVKNDTFKNKKKKF